MAQTERIVAVRLTAQTAPYVARMAAAARATDAVGSAAARANVAAQPMDRSLRNAARATELLNPKLIGAAGLVYGLSSVVSQAMAFEDQFAQVRKTMDGTREELDQVALDMRQLATEIPVTTTELNRIATVAGQLGISAENVVGFTEVVSQLSVTTNLTAEQAAIDFARLSNILGKPIDEVGELGNLAVRLGNNFAAQETEIMEFAQRIGGVGTQMGMTVDEIMALSAALPALGLRPEMGGTAITRIMVEIQAAVTEAGEKLAIFAETAGMSADEFAAAWRADPADALLTFTAGVGELDDRGVDAFETVADLDLSMIRTQDTMLRLAGGTEVYADALAIASDEMEAQSANQIEFDKRLDTTRSQLEIFKNNVREAAIELGGPLNEALGDTLRLLNDIWDGRPSDGILGAIADAMPGGTLFGRDPFTGEDRNILDAIMSGASQVTNPFGNAAQPWIDLFQSSAAQGRAQVDAGRQREMDALRAQADGYVAGLLGTTAGEERHLQAMRAEADQYVGSLEAMGAASDDTSRSTDHLVGELERAENQYEANADSVDLLSRAMDLLMGGNLRVADAELNRIRSFQDLNETLEASTKLHDEQGNVIGEVAASLDLATDAGLDNREAIIDYANSLRDEIQARHEQGESLGDVLALYDDHVEALKDSMVQFGLSEDEAQAYIDTLGLTPDTLVSEMIMNSDDAYQAAWDFYELTGRIPSSIETEVMVRVNRTALDRAMYLGQWEAQFAHTGGYVRPSGKIQKFHDGGMVGLKADEVPAILQTGEMVLSRHQVSELGSAFSRASEAMRPSTQLSGPLWGTVNFYGDVDTAVDRAHHKLRMQQWQGVYG